MAEYSDFVELNMTGLNVDHVRPQRSILRANFGDGYAETARVGAVGGTRQFVVSAGVWPDDDNLLPIGTDSWMEYYTNFFDERLDNANEPFIIEWRDRKWLVDMDESSYGVEVHTSDLFTPDGITLNLRRVSGLTHCRDGSLFDPSLITSYMWGRYRNAQDFPTSTPGPVGDAWVSEVDNVHGVNTLAVGGTDVISAADVLGTFDAVRFSSTTNNGVLASGSGAITLYDAWLVMKMREATFSNTAGILTGALAPNNAALVGASGTTKFFNFGFGSSYSYEKNNVSYAESDQQAPMNAFGVVHIRKTSGFALTDLQLGADRDFAGRFAETDIIEFVPCDAAVPYYWAEAFNRWLMTYYGIS